MGTEGALPVFHKDQHEQSLQVFQEHLGCLAPGQVAPLLEMAQVLATKRYMTEMNIAH